MTKKILIIGGTGDARRLADTLAADGDSHVILSLAGVTSSPTPSHDSVAIRRGGFGGAEGLCDYLKNENIAAVIDASHPFAAQISAHAARACDEVATPRFVLWRPQWEKTEKDNWREFATWVELIAAIPAGAKIFCAAGQEGIRAFAKSGRDDIAIIARAMETPAALPPAMQFIKGNPAKSWQDEAALFTKHAITHLAAKNAGGDSGYGKIEAAGRLGIPALMLARPAPPPPPLFSDPQSLIQSLLTVLS